MTAPDGAPVAAGAERQRESSLRVSERFYRSVVESSYDAVISCDGAGAITMWNRGAERLFGFKAHEMIGRPSTATAAADRRVKEQRLLTQALLGGTVDHVETERTTKYGAPIEVSLSMFALRDEDGAIVGATSIARDISAHKEVERQLRYFADHDALTGLLNRRRFSEELAQRMRYARRYRRRGALMLIDLDNFKLINDSAGHLEGDQVLRHAAAELRRCTRQTDVVARLGGDEFGVLLAELESAEAVEVARQLLASMAVPYNDRPVTISIGIATFGFDTTVLPEDVMAAADAALYQAKDAGRNQLVLSSGAGAQSLGWAQRIERALDRHGLRLEAQPIMNLRTGAREHVELLVRLRNNRGGLVAPSAFMPTAERTGLVRQIDRWVIERAVEYAAAGRTVAVNLSAASLCDPQLADHIAQRARAAAAPASNLVFEVSEASAAANTDEAHHLASGLGEIGARFALDDFGTGFGSLTYSRRLPVDYLKIDPELVRFVSSDAADRHVIQAVVALARGFGQRTIAKGVEDEQTLLTLADDGIDCAQGFHVGRPELIGVAG